MEREKILNVKNLSMYYKLEDRDVKAVNNLTFHLYKGEALGVVGESGCGKSSLALSLMMMPNIPGEIVDGEIILNGKTITSLNENDIRKQIRWKEIAMVFQGAMTSLTPVITIKNIMLETYYIHMGKNRKKAMETIAKYIKEVGLTEDILNRYPHQLSGGQKQRIVIAMALYLEAKVIIFDEPTTALDVVVQAQIINLIKTLKKELNISFIFITHDLGVVSEIADRICVMYGGEIVEIGTNKDIYSGEINHPYTARLIKATPLLYDKRDELEFIEGSPPSLSIDITGCKFYDRCNEKTNRCKEINPSLKKICDEHYVACVLRG